MKKILQILFFTLSLCTVVQAQQIIFDKQIPNSFSLSNASIYVDANDLPLVKRSAALLQQDIEAVTGHKPIIVNAVSNTKTLNSRLTAHDSLPASHNCIIIGSIE